MSAITSVLGTVHEDASATSVHKLVIRGDDWALASSDIIRLPWTLLAIYRQRSGRLEALELVLVGTDRNAVWRAMRVDLPFPHDVRRASQEFQDLAIRHLPEQVTIHTADGHPQQVDVWVLSAGTPIHNRLGAATQAVIDLLAPLGFDMEAI